MDLDLIKFIAFILANIIFGTCCFLGAIFFYRSNKLLKNELKEKENNE